MVEAVVEAAAVAAAVAGPAQSVLCYSVLTPVSVSLCLALPASPVRRLLSLSPCARPTASLYHRTLILLSLFLPSRSSNVLLRFFLFLSLPRTVHSHSRSLSLSLSFCCLLFCHDRFISLSFRPLAPRLSVRPSPSTHLPHPLPSPFALFHSIFLLLSSCVSHSSHSIFVFFFFLRLSSYRSRPRIADEPLDRVNRSSAIDGKSWHAPRRSIEIDRS